MKTIKNLPIAEIILVLLAVFLMFWKLGENHLTNWDEAWYADVSRTMSETGDLFTPVWNGNTFFEKPPFYFWASSASYLVFNDGEFAARFFSALAGVGTVWIVYRLGLLLWGKNYGIISAIVTLSTIGFLFRTRTGNIDTFFTFWIIAGMYCYYKGFIDKSKSWFVVMGLCIAGAFLTKGLLAFLFPVLAGVYLFFDRKSNELPNFLFGLIVCAGTIGLWIIIDFFANGGLYISSILLHQADKIGSSFNILSYFSFEYISHLKSGMKLWFVLFIPSFFYSAYRLKENSGILLSVFFAVFFFLLSFVESKSNWFLVPLYPVASLMIAYSILDIVHRIGKERYVKMGMIGTVGAIGLLQLFIYNEDYIVPDVAAQEADIAQKADEFMGKDDVLYLTNYYYPTSVYYSRRRTYAVYSQHDNNVWWVLKKSEWPKILKQSNVYIITTADELKQHEDYFLPYSFDILYQVGDKMFIKKSKIDL